MINNIPERTEAYIVAREIDGEFWFYATFADGDKANACADEIGGVVFSDWPPQERAKRLSLFLPVHFIDLKRWRSKLHFIDLKC